MTATIISKNGTFKSYTLDDVLSVSSVYNGKYRTIIIVFMDEDGDVKTTTYNADNVKISMDVC